MNRYALLAAGGLAIVVTGTVGVGGGMGRSFAEGGQGAQKQKAGQLGAKLDMDPRDRLLASRGAALLDGVTWSSVRSSGKLLVLSGLRGSEQFTVALRTTP